MNLSDQIKEILVISRSTANPYCKISKISGGYEIAYGMMYEAPQLSFSQLMGLSKLFGTHDINVDNYNSSGCDTCDYGSDYGHTIQITNVTENESELDRLVGQDLFSRD